MPTISVAMIVKNEAADLAQCLDTVKDWVDEISIKDEIKKLDDRERNIMYLRFMQGKTQMEVAREVGISQAQVSRLEKNALKRIKGE